MAPLTRIHTILQHSVVMRENDIEMVATQAEMLLGDPQFCAQPQIQACMMAEGWLPIASFLNYSPLGQTVWPCAASTLELLPHFMRYGTRHDVRFHHRFGGVGVVADCLSARGSHVVELSGDRSCVRKFPWRVRAVACLAAVAEAPSLSVTCLCHSVSRCKCEANSSTSSATRITTSA